MAFNMKYQIKADYIKKGSKRRPGTYITPNFGVLHDTGNKNSTAQNNVDFYKRTYNDENAASAHVFIDDKNIIECVPMITGKTERAHHVLYNKPKDNQMFGDDANDKAVGIELCFGDNINFEEAYKRYVWYAAYVAYYHKFSPTRYTGHEILDPGRKTDPTNALKRYGKSLSQLLQDILKEYNECTGQANPSKTVVQSPPKTVSSTVKSPKVTAMQLKYTGVLKEGSKGQAVKDLQNALNKLYNAKLKSDGDFGKASRAALINAQKKLGLKADGIAGQLTYSALNKQLAK